MNKLSKEWAIIILEMENVCYSEGHGPDTTEIMSYIRETYPELIEKYLWLCKYQKENHEKCHDYSLCD